MLNARRHHISLKSVHLTYSSNSQPRVLLEASITMLSAPDSSIDPLRLPLSSCPLRELL